MMVFKAVNPADIRGDGLTYELLILRQADRINEALREPLDKSPSITAYRMLNLQSLIYSLDCMVNYSDDGTIPDFDIGLINSGNPVKQLQYLEEVLKWYRRVVKSFGKIDLIPESKAIFTFGTGSWGDEITEENGPSIRPYSQKSNI